jgi:sigma-B regulation protein RsbU (phosphoserine phosphatase)
MRDCQPVRAITRRSDRNDDARSIGLGLFIVKEIAMAHGGDLTVRSDPIGGTTFTAPFTLPHRH